MLFVDTKRFSPVIFERDLPGQYDYFHLKPEEINKDFLDTGNYEIDEDWWEKQYERCINGYSVKDAIIQGGDCFIDGKDCIWYPDGDMYFKQYDLLIKNKTIKISGRMYFYLNFWPIYAKLKGKKIKGLTNPRFTDLDFLFARRIELMLERERDSLETKSRQKGFSEKAGGMILGYNYTFIDASVNLIVGGADADADHTMENCIRGLNYLQNTQFYKERAKGGNSSDLVKSKNTGSEIRSLTAYNNPQTVARFTPYWVIWEEIGKWSKGLLPQAKEFAKPAQEAEGTKTGFNTYIGTGGDMEAGAFDAEEMFYAPEANGLLEFDDLWEEDEESAYSGAKVAHFTPAYMFLIVDEDGNSLKNESIKKVLYDRSLKKTKDKFVHTTQFPLYVNHMFLISSGGFFGKEKIQKLNERIAQIRVKRNENIAFRVDLDWIDRHDYTKGVKEVEDPEGPFLIIEKPRTDDYGRVYENLYKGATDSYDKDEANNSTSLGSCTVAKGFLNANEVYNNWVARLTIRPDKFEGGSKKFYEKTAQLCMYYSAINLIEWSNIRIFDWYDDNGLSYMLKERPRFVTANWFKDSKVENRYGIDPNSKSHWLKMLDDFLDDSVISNMCDIEQIRAFAKFRYDPQKKYNCDITISSALNVVCLEDEKHLLIETTKDRPSFKPFGYRMGANRKIIQSC